MSAAQRVPEGMLEALARGMRRRREIEEAAGAAYETYRHRAGLDPGIGYCQLDNQTQQAWREVAECLRDWDWEDDE